MLQQDILYSHSSIFIVCCLFVAIMLMNEVSFRLGYFIQRNTDQEVRTLTASIQASLLGLLALLLGFTFSMSMQRFDSRSMALIDEANAIGTALMRVELLPQAFQGPAKAELLVYLDLRIALSKIELTRVDERERYNRDMAELQNRLWSLAVQATYEDPRPVTSGAFVKSLNDLVDSQGKRSALLQMQVPEIVLLLLFVVFISSGAILGYSAGLGGRRVVVPVMLVSLLISLIVFIIIDLDRPKRGVIQVNQAALLELQRAVKSNL